jgi:asparagine synthase (glutamine-hydrolysing)
MCGIAGITGPGAELDVVRRMSHALQHRGPDGSGLWSDPGVALGHRRLKIIDLTEAGQQPMSTADARYTIVYNGEVYNYQELRKELTDFHFHSQTDTEVVLYAYRRWGVDCLQKLVGMFAFAIWDKVEKTLFCARDRLGIKPFYYSVVAGSFVFGSEIRSLLAAGVEAKVNNPILYDFLARDFYEHSDETFFAGIYKLPAASWLLVKDGKPQPPQKYWHIDEEVQKWQISPDPQEREEIFLDLATRAVKEHLRSDVPVGVALSGGLDSTTLLSILDKVHPEPQMVEAFSFAFIEKEYSERPYVEEMARHTGRKAHFVELSHMRFAESIDRLSYSQEEPFAGVPIAAYTSCFELARQHDFTVIMDGSGLDEGLAGYGRFVPAMWADLYLGGNFEELAEEFAAAGITNSKGRKAALLQIKEAIQPGADSGKGQDLTSSVRPECLCSDFIGSIHHGPLRFEQPFPDTLRNLMYRELTYTKLPRALRFRDRLSMAVGMELRPPFLDHRLIGYEFALPREDFIKKNESKNILRRVGRKFLPDSIRLAAKHSVQTPQREWFRHELQDWVRERVDTKSFWERGWVDQKEGKKAMDSFFAGKGDNSFFLWQWINLEVWAQQFLDNPTR